jgi:DNA-binding beta-propeller fold protein YncE
VSRAWPAALLGLALVASGCGLRPACPAGMMVVASGLVHPRGMALAPDGALYVAEAGDDATGGRISRIGPDGASTVLVGGLPHSVNAGVEDVGTAGVALRNGELYAVEAEASGDLASSLFRLRSDGRAEKVADLLDFETRANPDGLGVESNPFGLLYEPSEDRFYATDGAGNSVVRIDPAGRVESVAAWLDDPVPTGLVRGPDGALYVSLFGGFPHGAGGGRVDRIDRDGRISNVVAGLTMPVGVAFVGATLHVLEFSGGLDLRPRLAFRPNSGRLLRVVGERREVLVEGLRYPTALLPDGSGGLLVADGGAIVGAGKGRVLRVAACRAR